jgi:glycosyltransferase involved in cell wall biosynthesis
MDDMKEELPLVSIIAACYNHALFVVEALDSIKNQRYPNIQLIITNDASTDKSKECIEL